MTIYRDQLEAVYRLIEKPECWTQEYIARTANGAGIHEDYDTNEEGGCLSERDIAHHPDASCWCLFGAAYKCGIRDDGLFVEALGGKTTLEIARFNDSHTHAEVLALLTTAIERAPVRP